MEYWTIKDNRHAGPFTAAQLADMGIAPDTPVWHEGLTDWVPARQIPEIAAIMVARQNAAAARPQPAPYAPVYASAPPRQPERPSASAATGEECPPTYLGWSIAALILCCMPLGIAAVIFSGQVKSAWRSGDIDKARRASERAQWCIILSMSLGMILQLFWGVFQAAAGL